MGLMIELEWGGGRVHIRLISVYAFNIYKKICF